VDCVVAGAADGTTTGRRNYEILLLLARTGPRVHEVAQLSLDDIDWREGVINVRSKKTRNERRLPLAHDVGAAIVDYLEHGRPPCGSRKIFLRVTPPFVPFLGSAGICRLTRRALTRAGLHNTRAAAHLFRHTAATRMVRGGASFKDIADVRGHAAISTTAMIYAKLDTAGLSRVAMPWAGRDAMKARELRIQLDQYLSARSASGIKDRGRKTLLQGFVFHPSERLLDLQHQRNDRCALLGPPLTFRRLTLVLGFRAVCIPWLFKNKIKPKIPNLIPNYTRY